MAADVLEVLEGGGVVDLESLPESEDVWTSSTGGDMAKTLGCDATVSSGE